MSSYSIDTLVIPTEDAHQSEYVAKTDKRRAFISGFTGNAGLAVITKNEALLWMDGRYFFQATQELSNSWKLMRIVEDPIVETWLADNLTEGASAGVDPWCISVDTSPKISPAYVQPLEFAGRPVSEKLSNLREKLSQEKSRAIIIAALDEVAWLYNIRGSDVEYNPGVHAFAIITKSSAFLYVDKKKITPEVEKHLPENGIAIHDYEIVLSDVVLLSSNELKGTIENGAKVGITSQKGETNGNDLESEGAAENHNTIWIDPASCCFSLYKRLPIDQVL